MSFSYFQIFRSDLLGVVATSEMICDIGAAENKSLSYYREYLEVSQIILISKLRSKILLVASLGKSGKAERSRSEKLK